MKLSKKFILDFLRLLMKLEVMEIQSLIKNMQKKILKCLPTKPKHVVVAIK